MTLTLSDAVIDLGITVNAVNPGPVDTGWATDELTTELARLAPGPVDRAPPRWPPWSPGW